MAVTVDLTPQSTNYIIALEYGDTIQNINPLQPLSVDPLSLIEGETDRIEIVITGNGGVGGVFKNPPFVLDVTLNDAAIYDGDNAILAHLDKGVICTPDGRIFFDPSFASMVIRAAKYHGIGLADVAYIVLNLTAAPVYRNPSGATPAFDPKTFSVSFDMTDINLIELMPYDQAETKPWIYYAGQTALTPAGIGAVTAID